MVGEIFLNVVAFSLFSMYRKLTKKLSMRFSWRCWITTSNGANTCENALLGIGLVPPVILKELFFMPLVWVLFVSYSIEAINRDRKLFLVSLYYLIWGEAANVRFLPECICYIFHHVSLTTLLFNSLWVHHWVCYLLCSNFILPPLYNYNLFLLIIVDIIIIYCTKSFTLWLEICHFAIHGEK